MKPRGCQIDLVQMVTGHALDPERGTGHASSVMTAEPELQFAKTEKETGYHMWESE